MQGLLESSVLVAVPARPDFIHVLRSVTASVAARLDFPYDAIDDLRLAIDEACAQLLAIVDDGATLTVRMSATEEGLEVAATIHGSSASWPPPNAEESLSWRLMSALADEARFERSDEGPALRLVKRLPRSTEPAENPRVPTE